MEIKLHFGALAEPLEKQISKQLTKLSKADKMQIQVFQQLADAITRLYVNGYMPDHLVEKARKKLVKAIGDAL